MFDIKNARRNIQHKIEAIEKFAMADLEARSIDGFTANLAELSGMLTVLETLAKTGGDVTSDLAHELAAPARSAYYRLRAAMRQQP